MSKRKQQDERIDQRLIVLLRQSQLERLKEASNLTGAPVGELVRRAIDAYALPQRLRTTGRQRS